MWSSKKLIFKIRSHTTNRSQGELCRSVLKSVEKCKRFLCPTSQGVRGGEKVQNYKRNVGNYGDCANDRGKLTKAGT